MTEVAARAPLRAFDGVNGVEHWIACQAGGTGRLDSLSRFDRMAVPAAARPWRTHVSAPAPGGRWPATWVVPRPCPLPASSSRGATPSHKEGPPD
jgi:hypothetical protein